MAKQKKTPSIPEVIRRRRADYLIARSYLSLGVRIAVLALVLFILLTQVFLLTQVSGNGMFPALEDGDVIFAYRLQEEYAKNDVVVYTAGGETRVGRVLGRPTDVVTLDDSGTLLINGTAQGGEIMYPTYAKEGITYPFVVPEDAWFILGDYRTQTEDSRDFGAIHSAEIMGKVITILRRRGI